MERLVAHRTRVVVPGRGAGMVVRVDNAYRELSGTVLLDVPARVHVVLDSGGRAIVAATDVSVEGAAA